LSPPADVMASPAVDRATNAHPIRPSDSTWTRGAAGILPNPRSRRKHSCGRLAGADDPAQAESMVTLTRIADTATPVPGDGGRDGDHLACTARSSA